ncbi:probable phospholipase, mitochondrial [[Candida] railenensis]|uniref:Probable phospholipase, mitochondrial n=1 Tax=[Candida] railenensis TaxID=45579 RepID=A0A9P0VY24_9ASCO|nr:probable phospholipase, mitochondrial [[Candida] railenensis]
MLYLYRKRCLNSISQSIRSFSSQSFLYKTATDSKNVGEVPKLNVKWYYATDVPLSKPEWYEFDQDKKASKFLPFSAFDSVRLEKRFQAIHRNSSGGENQEKQLPHTIEVNEDRLFQVDIKEMTLSPVYWQGPVYEVRRGTWFNSDGIPLPNSLSQAIEVGYQSKKPYLFNEEIKLKKQKVLDSSAESTNAEKVTKASKDAVIQFNKLTNAIKKDKADEVIVENEKDIINLGNGQLILFCDEKYAALFPDTVNSAFEIDVIRNISSSPGVALLSVDKIQRGFTDDLSNTIFDSLPDNPIPGFADSFKNEVNQLFNPVKQDATDSATPGSEEEVDKKARHVLEADYDHDSTKAKANRRVDHLILCIHGIGQVLGGKYESIDFTHSVNVMRNTMKDVYKSDERYVKLAHENEEERDEDYLENNTIQVLPISWRHRLDFQPSKNFESFDDDGNYRLPKLSQINVDGVKSLRNMVGDVLLDVLLYYEPHYIEQVFKIVISELNKVYQLYIEKNPGFNGKVHILGHSLGSAIAFDIMSSQYNERPKDLDLTKDLSFDVDSLFCVGSPVGVFKFLTQQNISARSSMSESFDPRSSKNLQSSPKCENLYNIFHPCDPVGYRMEPLVSPKFANFKPESVPFAVKGLNTQIKELASFGEAIHQKLTASIFGTKKHKTVEDGSIVEESRKKKKKKSVDEEDALSDILRGIVADSDKGDSKTNPASIVEMRERDLSILNELNRSGRIDYCLPMGVFDISLLSALSSHVSYFEDKDTAGFIMKEILSSDKDSTESKKVALYVKK